MQTITKQQYDAITEILKAIGDAIQESPNGLPAGSLYAQLMPFGITLSQYESIEECFIKAGKVRKQGNLLFWIN